MTAGYHLIAHDTLIRRENCFYIDNTGCVAAIGGPGLAALWQRRQRRYGDPPTRIKIAFVLLGGYACRYAQGRASAPGRTFLLIRGLVSLDRMTIDLRFRALCGLVWYATRLGRQTQVRVARVRNLAAAPWCARRLILVAAWCAYSALRRIGRGRAGRLLPGPLGMVGLCAQPHAADGTLGPRRSFPRQIERQSRIGLNLFAVAERGGEPRDHGIEGIWLALLLILSGMETNINAAGACRADRHPVSCLRTSAADIWVRLRYGRRCRLVILMGLLACGAPCLSVRLLVLPRYRACSIAQLKGALRGFYRRSDPLSKRSGVYWRVSSRPLAANSKLPRLAPCLPQVPKLGEILMFFGYLCRFACYL